MGEQSSGNPGRFLPQPAIGEFLRGPVVTEHAQMHPIRMRPGMPGQRLGDR